MATTSEINANFNMEVDKALHEIIEPILMKRTRRVDPMNPTDTVDWDIDQEDDPVDETEEEVEKKREFVRKLLKKPAARETMAVTLTCPNRRQALEEPDFIPDHFFGSINSMLPELVESVLMDEAVIKNSELTKQLVEQLVANLQACKLEPKDTLEEQRLANLETMLHGMAAIKSNMEQEILALNDSEITAERFQRS